ncbi:MAG: hypothetical protein WC272_09665 [Sulfurimonas sp.]|jgi:hypothetical protein
MNTQIKSKKIEVTELGNMNGCYNLVVLYANGDGVRQDKLKAKELFGKSCDGGNNDGCKNYKEV